MIKIENVEVYGFEAAIRGCRNSWDSWEKSDSFLCECNKGKCKMSDCPQYKKNGCEISRLTDYIIGEADLKLLSNLVRAGDSHAKAMRMINVYCDITAPRYWWTEFDTYKHTVRCSCSTMHTITKKEFSADDFTFDDFLCDHSFTHSLIKTLNVFRKRFLKSQDKKFWRAIIQLLPQSYKQKSTVMLNYQVLRNMYLQRKGHKLEEWQQFRKWIEGLPYSELITGKDKEKELEKWSLMS